VETLPATRISDVSLSLCSATLVVQILFSVGDIKVYSLESVVTAQWFGKIVQTHAASWRCGVLAVRWCSESVKAPTKRLLLAQFGPPRQYTKLSPELSQRPLNYTSTRDLSKINHSRLNQNDSSPKPRYRDQRGTTVPSGTAVPERGPEALSRLILWDGSRHSSVRAAADNNAAVHHGRAETTSMATMSGGL
jgi:hypothetical protein